MTSSAPDSGPDQDVSLRLERVGLQSRLQEIDFELSAGRCVVIAGPNGAGKSTLLRVLAGLETPDQGRVLCGERLLSALPPAQRAETLAWLPQRPRITPGMTTDELVAAARYRFSEPYGRSLKEARQILEAQDSSELVGRYVDQISGGELQRVLLCTLVAQDAPLLLVDEPANHLDPRHQVETYRRLGALWREQGRGLVVVTHDVRLSLLLGPPDQVHVLGLKDGRRSFETTLSDEQLPDTLHKLYGVPFAPASGPAALALSLELDA